MFHPDGVSPTPSAVFERVFSGFTAEAALIFNGWAYRIVGVSYDWSHRRFDTQEEAFEAARISIEGN